MSQPFAAALFVRVGPPPHSLEMPVTTSFGLMRDPPMALMRAEDGEQVSGVTKSGATSQRLSPRWRR